MNVYKALHVIVLFCVMNKGLDCVNRKQDRSAMRHDSIESSSNGGGSGSSRGRSGWWGGGRNRSSKPSSSSRRGSGWLGGGRNRPSKPSSPSRRRSGWWGGGRNKPSKPSTRPRPRPAAPKLRPKPAAPKPKARSRGWLFGKKKAQPKPKPRPRPRPAAPKLRPKPAAPKPKARSRGWLFGKKKTQPKPKPKPVPEQKPAPKPIPQPKPAPKSKPGPQQVPHPKPKPAVKPKQNTKSETDMKKVIEGYEDIELTAYDAQPKNKKVHDTTIGIGFNLNRPDAEKTFKKLLPGVDFNKVKSGKLSITEEQARALFDHDVNNIYEPRARNKIGKAVYDKLPSNVKTAVVNAVFRGDLGPKTAKLIKQGKWKEVGKEYLDHDQYKNAKTLGIRGIKPRMEWNKEQFDTMIKQKKPK